MTEEQFKRYRRKLRDVDNRYGEPGLITSRSVVALLTYGEMIGIKLKSKEYYGLIHSGGELMLLYIPELGGDTGFPSVIERGPKALYSFQEELGVDFAEVYMGLELLLGDDD